MNVETVLRGADFEAFDHNSASTTGFTLAKLERLPKRKVKRSHAISRGSSTSHALAPLAAVSCPALNNSTQLDVARTLLSGGRAMWSVEREFESLFRSQVRELEAADSLKTPVRKPALTPLREAEVPSVSVRQQRPVRELEAGAEVMPKRALPTFKRNLVESRRAMRSMQRVASTSFVAALSANIPMTVLVATTAVTTA